MRIAFCGHSYHRTTKSSAFFVELLETAGIVEHFWDESWRTGNHLETTPIIEGEFDAIVVWQMERLALRLARANVRNLTFVPMFDGCHALPDSFWRLFGQHKILSFSSSLHERLRRLGAPSQFVRFFPDPDKYQLCAQDSGIRGYFWQRQQDITWQKIRKLCEGTKFDRFTLHRAVDPSFGDFVAPSSDDVERFSLRFTDWHISREAAIADLLEQDVYFAPRLREGIGMAFLEAMAMGMLVVAPNFPTANEYIVSGVNGLLYDPANPEPLDFSKYRVLGANAARSIRQGHVTWRRSMPALVDFVLGETSVVGARRHFGAFDPKSIENILSVPRIAPEAQSSRGDARPNTGECLRGGKRLAGIVRNDSRVEAPLVTVAVVTRNAESTLEQTLRSVILQDWPNLELIVIDGASSDGTLRVIEKFEDDIDYWQSEPDAGPYDAMNKAVDFAGGRYVLFLNAGDWFQTTDALSSCLVGADLSADVIYGHHIYRDINGHDEIHLAAEFKETWERLRKGDVGWQWLSGVPGHQATLTRAELLRRLRFRRGLRIAADHELLYRIASEGGRFHHSGCVVATYVSGGLSWTNRERCFDEWAAIAIEYTLHPTAVRRHFSKMRRQMQIGHLKELANRQLLERIWSDRATLPLLLWRLVTFIRGRLSRALNRSQCLEVNFAARDLGPSVRFSRGLSDPEPWGRWTDDDRVVIAFEAPLPSPCRLRIKIRQVFGPNVGQMMGIRVGTADFMHVLTAGRQTVSVIVNGEKGPRADQLEIVVPAPTSPRALGWSDDSRRLGVALWSVEIFPHRR
jgi:glycosyltransferase involved in cell wall biosynthesis